MQKTRLYFMYAFIEFARVYASENIGEVEIDVDKICSYIASDKFFTDWGDCISLEDCYAHIEALVASGYPFWTMFKLSDWTNDILTKEFNQAAEEHNNSLLKKYKCFTCKNFWIIESSFGTKYDCRSQEKRDKIEDKFSKKMKLPLCRCSYYEKGIPYKKYYKSNKEKIEDLLKIK